MWLYGIICVYILYYILYIVVQYFMFNCLSVFITLVGWEILSIYHHNLPWGAHSDIRRSTRQPRAAPLLSMSCSRFMFVGCDWAQVEMVEIESNISEYFRMSSTNFGYSVSCFGNFGEGPGLPSTSGSSGSCSSCSSCRLETLPTIDENQMGPWIGTHRTQVM